MVTLPFAPPGKNRLIFRKNQCALRNPRAACPFGIPAHKPIAAAGGGACQSGSAANGIPDSHRFPISAKGSAIGIEGQLNPVGRPSRVDGQVLRNIVKPSAPPVESVAGSRRVAWCDGRRAVEDISPRGYRLVVASECDGIDVEQCDPNAMLRGVSVRS